MRTPADFDISGYRGDYYESSISSPISNRHRSYREPLGADDTPVYNNPLWTINEQENLVDVDRFISSLELKATPLTWLELIGRVGLDTYSKNHDGSHAPYAIAFDGTYVYSSLWGVIQVHNVSNVNSPTLHAFIETNANTYQIDVSGDYIFLSNRSTGGIQIIDTRLLKTVSRWTNSGGDNSVSYTHLTLPTSLGG